MRRAVVGFALLAACGDNRAPDDLMQSGERLRLVKYDLADGTRTFDPTVFHDRALHEDCTIERFSSGERYCMPVTAGGTVVFTTDACTRALGATESTEPPRYFVRPFQLHGTSLPSRLYRSGPQTDAPTNVWRQQDEYCVGPFQPPAEHAFFELGEEIAADALVRIRERDTMSEGRLTIGFDESDDGWRLPGALTDDIAGPCSLLPSANADVVPCLPAARSTPFSDPLCAQPLAAAEIAAHRDVDSGCWSLLEPGERFAGEAYERIGESCVAVGTNLQLFTPSAIREVATLPRRRGEPEHRTAEISFGTLARDVFRHDEVLAADCRIEAVEGGYACVPGSSVAALPFFDDAACSVPILVAFVPTGSCEPPSLFASGFRIGEVRTAPIYEVTTGDRCAAYSPPVRFAIHSLDAAPTTDLVTATRTID